jgi:hypothetical protein
MYQVKKVLFKKFKLVYLIIAFAKIPILTPNSIKSPFNFKQLVADHCKT